MISKFLLREILLVNDINYSLFIITQRCCETSEEDLEHNMKVIKKMTIKICIQPEPEINWVNVACQIVN